MKKRVSYKSVEELATHIRSLKSQNSRMVIAIDGISASGKTTLASELSKACGVKVFSLDDYLLPARQRFQKTIEAPRDKRTEILIINLYDLPKAKGSFSQSEPPIIIEGTFLFRTILRGFKADISILVDTDPLITRKRRMESMRSRFPGLSEKEIEAINGFYELAWESYISGVSGRFDASIAGA